MDRNRESLRKFSEKRILTTAIGALSDLEEKFGFLWNHGNSPTTNDEKHFEKLYQDMRKDILDRANAQIRSLNSELNAYEVLRMKFKYNLPVRRNDGH